MFYLMLSTVQRLHSSLCYYTLPSPTLLKSISSKPSVGCAHYIHNIWLLLSAVTIPYYTAYNLYVHRCIKNKELY